MMQEYDLVVIGAGWAGIAVAKTFHQLNPSQSLLILDANATIGGVWATERLYPGLKTNCLFGTYEYPDFPMTTDLFGVKPGEHIPGHVCHAYLAKVAEKFGIADKIRYSTRVLTAEQQDESGWILETVTTTTTAKDDNSNNNSSSTTLAAKKLVVATGLTSQPILPHVSGQETFNKPIFHAKDFASHASTLDTAHRVTVLGGAKTAWDAVYAYASRGIAVDWVIRASGHGPVWMSPPFVTPLHKWLEKLVMTRLLTWFSPCVWPTTAADDDDGGFPAMVRRFLHGTALGRMLTNAFWRVLGNDVLARNPYDAHPQTAKLRPWSDPMLTASSFSILNYDTDFFQLVRERDVKVHIADIARLGPDGAIHLADDANTVLTADALCCVTGWDWTAPLTFLPAGLDVELGVPHPPSPKDPVELIAKADHEILTRFPRLAQKTTTTTNHGVASAETTEPMTPWSLHRFMVPPTRRRRDIAFAGFMMNFNIPLNDHMQALWINAYFSGRGLALPDSDGDDKLHYETVLCSRFGRWRYPAGRGSQFPDMVFDALPYVDWLARDLGVRVHRKGAWWREWVQSYGPEDYKDVVDEWRAVHGVGLL